MVPFFHYRSLTDAKVDSLALDLGYIPLPDVVKSLSIAQILQVKCGGVRVRKEVFITAGGSKQVATVMNGLMASYSSTHTEVQMGYNKVWAKILC